MDKRQLQDSIGKLNKHVFLFVVFDFGIDKDIF